MTTSEEDRGLRAVRRVRDVRENDSRYGLSVALRSVHDRDAEVDAVGARLATTEDFADGSVADFRGHLDRLSTLVRLERQAVERAEASRAVAAEAQRRWQHERQRVRVVDLLLERRAATRATERARREQAALDDVATQGWLRRQAPAEPGQQPP
ncbi:MAG: flagellar FliJ family protein, partial [Nocardioidaceae bacterium]